MHPREEHRTPNTARDAPGALRRTFRSLDSYNYRLYFAGDLVSHVGSWMQTMAEAALVETLTHSGVAVGATFAFRFLPVLLFGLWGGAIADRFDRRKVLLVTQTLAAALAVALWLIVLTGIVQVWMVFALAVGLGFVTVVDEPTRQAFVEEMVGREAVPNAVALTSAVGNSARITGPALAGLLFATVGAAWVFFVNAASFFAVVAALVAMRTAALHRPGHDSAHRERPRVREGLAYAWSLTEIRTTMLLVVVVGTLVYNFPTFLTLMAFDTFHGGAGLAGLLMVVLGVGTVIGALTAAARSRPTRSTVVGAAALLGCMLVITAAAPTRPATYLALVPLGALAVFFGSTANAHMQIWSVASMRGRVMAIYTLSTLGTTVIGGPLVGWICQHWSPRTGLAFAGAVTLTAAVALAIPLAVRRRAAGWVALPAPAAGD
ncbi:MAG TPA: MFS transporter [Acidimicrobiia bacterium]|nr:MFS transporter [Acidimicrobiia bacterium]